MKEYRVITLYSKELSKEKRIYVYLPRSYHTTEKHYPVMYMHDGQNLFDDYAPFGNWAVDKKLAVMAAQGFGEVIVIAIRLPASAAAPRSPWATS